MPGTSDGKRLTPPASVTPVIDPATSTGLLIVTRDAGHHRALIVDGSDQNAAGLHLGTAR